MATEAEVHNEYLKIVKSVLAKISDKHPGADPQKVLGGAMQSMGSLLVNLGDFTPAESFLVLGFVATIGSAALLKDKGPNEVAPFVKSMAELFAYTLLDRIPSAIDQITKQEAKLQAKVKLPSA